LGSKGRYPNKNDKSYRPGFRRSKGFGYKGKPPYKNTTLGNKIPTKRKKKLLMLSLISLLKRK
jgi:hypothetical protein